MTNQKKQIWNNSQTDTVKINNLFCLGNKMLYMIYQVNMR